MKRIKILTVIFEPVIKGNEIPLFRGAIIKKAGKDAHLFHNHLGDKFIYKYPLIQYKRINKHATIVCIDKGIDEIYKIFNNPDWKIKIGSEEKELKIVKLTVNQFTLNVWQKFFTYKIYNWLALNEENYKTFKKLTSTDEKINFLKRILVGNILSFAKGVDWFIDKDKQIKAEILSLEREKKVYYKNSPLLAFDITFRTNVFIPENIGLGKGVSKGFGIVKRAKGEILAG